jgi:hypothetical protein
MDRLSAQFEFRLRLPFDCSNRCYSWRKIQFAIDTDVPLNLTVVLSHPPSTNYILNVSVGSVLPLRSQFAVIAKLEDDRILSDGRGKLYAIGPTKQDSDSMPIFSPFSYVLGWSGCVTTAARCD